MDDRSLTGKRILVVEDEMLVAMAIEDMLGDLGCDSITVAGNIHAALETIKADWFDLATLDVNLGGIRSDEIADALRKRGIPFLFSTGYGDHGVDEGYEDSVVLKKPYTLFQFERAVSKLLNGADASPCPPDGPTIAH
jgi:CheY-like chemotaxis protein